MVTWHYAARKTKDPLGGDLYELVEVMGGGYTENAVTVSAESREELAKWLRIAADDVIRHDAIDEGDD